MIKRFRITQKEELVLTDADGAPTGVVVLLFTGFPNGEDSPALKVGTTRIHSKFEENDVVVVDYAPRVAGDKYEYTNKDGKVIKGACKKDGNWASDMNKADAKKYDRELNDLVDANTYHSILSDDTKDDRIAQLLASSKQPHITG